MNPFVVTDPPSDRCTRRRARLAPQRAASRINKYIDIDIDIDR